MLRTLEAFPTALLDTGPTGLNALLGGPTLLHLPGRRPEPLFVAALLHGNEDTGFLAVRELLRRYHGETLPRALSIFIGNVAAAEQGLRRLDGQPDYNRVWPGSEEAPTAEHALMAEVVETMAQRKVFASVDVHNNTGINPHYGCVNRIDYRYLHLATLFSRTVVYFTRPRGVQSLAFSKLCPAVTVECGQPGQPHGIAHACDYLDACLRLSDIPVHPVARHDIDLFHTVAVVKVPRHISFGFGEAPGDIRFLPDLDHYNFRELPEGTPLAWVDSALSAQPLEAWDETGRDVSSRYFRLENGQLRLRRSLMPSMFTLDTRIVRQDCLGYLMERYELIDAERA